MHRLLNGPGAGTWRFRGRFVPSRDVERVLADADLTRVVTAADDGRVVGLCQLHDLQPLDRHAQLSVLAADPRDPFGLTAEGAIAFMHEAFLRFDLRKLYCYLSESSMAATGAVLRAHARLEGHLAGHVRLDGRWQDVTILSLTPDGLQSLLGRPGLRHLTRVRTGAGARP